MPSVDTYNLQLLVDELDKMPCKYGQLYVETPIADDDYQAILKLRSAIDNDTDQLNDNVINQINAVLRHLLKIPNLKLNDRQRVAFDSVITTLKDCRMNVKKCIG